MPPAPALDPAALRRALWLAAAAVGVVWLAPLALWGEAPFAVTFDDAWYYFEIGRNLADGHGSTFDTINETNGYHPLWMAVTTSVYAVGADDLVAVRLLLVLQLGCWVAALALVGIVTAAATGRADRAAERAADPTSHRTSEPTSDRAADRPDAAVAARRITATAAVALLLIGANPSVIKTTVNGLESGVVVLTQAALLALLWRREGRVLDGPVRGRLLLGVVLAATVLARTDALVLAGCLGLWGLAEAGRDLRRALGLVPVAAPTAVVSAAWFALNQAAFGSPLQVSGELKRLDLTPRSALVLAVLAALAVGLGRRARLRLRVPNRRSRLPRVATFAARTAPFAGFLLLLAGYYTQLSAQQWLWYFAPHVLYLTFLAVLATVDFGEGVVADAPADRSAARALLPMQVILLGVFSVAGVAATVSFVDPGQRSIQLANRDAGRWMSANLAPDAVIGSWDAGVLGYFTEQPVVNLDGVVNSFEWLDAVRGGTTRDFLLDRDLAYLANHAGMGPDGEDPGIRDDIERLIGPAEAAGAVQVHREEFTYTGRIEGSAGAGPTDWAVFVYRLGPGDAGP